MILVVLASASTASAGRRPHRPNEGVPDNIRYYESVAMMSGAAANQAAAGPTDTKTIDVSFYTLGRVFDLRLEAHDPYTPGAMVRWVDDSGVVEEPAPSGIFFRGAVEGDPNSWARITLRGDALAGVVSTDDELYFLEPAERFFGAQASSETLAYRMSDTDMGPIATSCGVSGKSALGKRRKSVPGAVRRALRELLGHAATTSAAAGLQQADLGLTADFEYFSAHGASSATDLAEIVNSTDGIYQSELSVTVQIGSTVVFTTESDPFSSTSVPLTLLQEAAAWRDTNDNNSSQPMWNTHLTHLFTGRDLNSNVIGIAFLGSLCDSGGSAGVDQDWTTSLNLMSMLLAHEMGHNFGAPHDAQSGSACVDEPATYIMNPSIGPSLQRRFSPCSKSKINSYIGSHSCLEPAGPTATPTNTFTPTPSPTPTLGVPSVTEPFSGQVIGVEGVSFTWTSVSNATAYDLRVLNGSGATVFSGTLNGGGSVTTLIGLPNNGSYTFRVRACRAPVSDSTCGGFASRNFTVTLVAPTAAPTIVFPANGATLNASSQTLQWTTVTGNPALPDMFYEVRLTNRANGQTVVMLRTKHPSAQTTVLLASMQYRLQVRACQAACGPLSAPVDFTVALGQVPTTAPSINSAQVDGGNSLTVDWTAVAGAEWYQVQIVQPAPAGPGGGALTVAARQVAGATSVTLPVPAGQAYVFVAACNGDGCGPKNSAFSVTPTQNPAAPQVGSPLNGSVVNGPSVIFTWTRIPGDTGNTVYRVYVQDVSRLRAALDVFTTQNFYGALLKAEGGKYAVVVIANPGQQGQVSSPAVAFTVAGSSAVAPTLMAPTNGSVLPAGNVLVGWTPVPGATLYEYLLTAQGQGTATGRGVTPGIFVQVPVAALNGQPTLYNGIVRACPAGQTCASGSDAGWGPWSSAAGSGGVAFTVTNP